MVILGLNYYFHDSTACIVVDGKLVAAIEEGLMTNNDGLQNYGKMGFSITVS